MKTNCMFSAEAAEIDQSVNDYSKSKSIQIRGISRLKVLTDNIEPDTP